MQSMGGRGICHNRTMLDSHLNTVHEIAMAKRLLTLSLAHRERSMTEHQLLLYKDELVAVCRRQVENFERLGGEGGDSTPRRVLRYLDGVLQLAGRFVRMSHIEVMREVGRLEEQLASAVMSRGIAA